MKLRANVRPQWQWAKLKQLLAIVLMFWGTISMYGQSKMISGIVQSESDGEPLVGATVIVKETKAGGTTDLNGRYSVQAGQGQTLIVSYIGYRSKEIKVGKNSRIDVQLQEDNEMLDEVVVVGYGTMKRSDLTGSVVSVTGDELKKIRSHLARPSFARTRRRCTSNAELRYSGWRYLRQYPWHQLPERQRTALRHRRCSHIG